MGAEEILLESPLMHPACWPKFGPQCLREEFSWWPSSSKVPMLPSSCLTVSHEHRSSEFLPPCPSSAPLWSHPASTQKHPLPKLLEICVKERPQRSPQGPLRTRRSLTLQNRKGGNPLALLVTVLAVRQLLPLSFVSSCLSPFPSPKGNWDVLSDPAKVFAMG